MARTPMDLPRYTCQDLEWMKHIIETTHKWMNYNMVLKVLPADEVWSSLLKFPSAKLFSFVILSKGKQQTMKEICNSSTYATYQEVSQ